MKNFVGVLIAYWWMIALFFAGFCFIKSWIIVGIILVLAGGFGAYKFFKQIE